MKLGSEACMHREGSEIMFIVKIAYDAVRIDVAHLDGSRRSKLELGSGHTLEERQIAWERVVMDPLKATIGWTAEEDDGWRGNVSRSRRVLGRAVAEWRKGVDMWMGCGAVQRCRRQLFIVSSDAEADIRRPGASSLLAVLEVVCIGTGVCHVLAWRIHVGRILQ